ncbi:MAG: hypothetical protein EBZ17_00065 [Actinobacteria bacterium]|nr:hypothetical protein [Actinomycetota bacterium]
MDDQLLGEGDHIVEGDRGVLIQRFLFDCAEGCQEEPSERVGLTASGDLPALLPGADHRSDEFDARFDGLRCSRGMLGGEARQLIDDDSGKVGVFSGDLGIELGDLEEVPARTPTFVRDEACDELIAPVLDDGEEEVLFGVEVVVDRAFRVPGGQRDLVETGTRKPSSSELGLPGFHQPSACGVAFACGNSGHNRIMGNSPHKSRSGAMGDVESLETLEEDADFLEYCYRSVLSELGFSAEHAAVVAACVSDGDRNGKLTQGMGVFEIPVLLARTGTMDVNAEPVVAAEGPSWLVVDAQRSSGQWAVTMAMRAAIAKAREHAIAIGFVRDFNDAGAFGTYVRMAAREGMMAIATNNSLPLVSPWGGMENVLSGAPFAAATPGGEHPPIVSDIQAVEVHDGDLSEAYFQGRRLKGEFLVDPHTGELTDDPAPYFERMEDYGRISDCRAPTVFGTPRMYAFNLFTEMLAGVINPGARMSPEIAGPPSYWLEPRDEALTGGACVIVIDPSHWMPAGEAGARSDRLVDAVKGAKRRPGVEEIHLPGERGWRTMATGAPVRILPAHWESFVQIVESVGLTIDGLRASHTRGE